MSEEPPRHDAPNEPAGEPPDESAPEQVPLEAISTRELLVWMLGILGAKAWQGMGLVPNPGSGKIEKDLGDAKIAIDAFAAVLETMRPQLEGQVLRDSETLLTTLRLNFVEKSSSS